MVLERGRMTGTLPGRDGADWRLREAPSSGMLGSSASRWWRSALEFVKREE